MTRAVDVIVMGRVQGVSFRAFVEREARRLGVTGWIRNEPDGSVAGHFEGADPGVALLVESCRTGPAYAHVERVDVRPGSVTGATDFRLRF
jgi:acylphosphatase